MSDNQVTEPVEKILEVLEGEASTEELQEEVQEGETQEITPEPEVQLYTIKENGEEHQVTLDELRNGYQRQQDYSRKTQELSEQRKQSETERQAIRQDYTRNLEILHKAVYRQALGDLSGVDLNKLADEDPAEYIRVTNKINNVKNTLDTISAEHSRSGQELNQQRNEAMRELTSAGQSILAKDIPGWGDDIRAELLSYGKKSGFDDGELSSIVDPRMVKVLHKASLYDKLQSSTKDAAVKIGKIPPKTERPGQSQSTPDMKNLLNSGKKEDRITYLEKLFSR